MILTADCKGSSLATNSILRIDEYHDTSIELFADKLGGEEQPT